MTDSENLNRRITKYKKKYKLPWIIQIKSVKGLKIEGFIKTNIGSSKKSIPVLGQLTKEIILLKLNLQKNDEDFSLKDITEFATDSCLVDYLPMSEVLFNTVKLTQLNLQLSLDNKKPTELTVICDVGQEWEVVPKLIKLKNLGTTIRASYIPIGNELSLFYGGNIHGTIEIGDADFDVSIPFTGLHYLQISVHPKDTSGNPLGLPDLAGLIGGEGVKSAIKSALEAIHLLDDISIDAVEIAFLLANKSLYYVAISSHVTIAGVRIDLYTQPPLGTSKGW